MNIKNQERIHGPFIITFLDSEYKGLEPKEEGGRRNINNQRIDPRKYRWLNRKKKYMKTQIPHTNSLDSKYKELEPKEDGEDHKQQN